MGKFSYSASLKDVIDAVNEGLQMLSDLTWTANSIKHLPEEITKEFTARDSQFLLNEVFEVTESGKYNIRIAGKGKSNYTIKSPDKNRVLYTEKNIDDAYETSDLILGKGDLLYVNASADTGQFVRIQLVRTGTFLELVQGLHDDFIKTTRELKGQIDTFENVILEGWMSDGNSPLRFYDKSDVDKTTPIVPAIGKIYINLLNNLLYRWDDDNKCFIQLGRQD